MMKLQLSFLLLVFCISTSVEVKAQTIQASVPAAPDTSGIYLFYLHGGIVQQQGPNAVSEHFGAYKYQDILDTLRGKGFHVISEVRPKDSEEKDYAVKLNRQIDTLLSRGVPDKNIVVVGASLGAYIALEASILNSNPNIRFVILGLCSAYAVEYFQAFQKDLTGQFLSIYESSDSKGSCKSVFEDLQAETKFQEVELQMGIGHAFLYRPFDEWVKPLVHWIRNP